MDYELNNYIRKYIKERNNIFKKYSKGGNMIERFKSPVFWTQFVLLIAEMLKLCGVYEISNEVLNSIQDVITLAFQIFAGLNNPTDRKKF